MLRFTPGQSTAMPVDVVTCGDPKDAMVAFESIVKSFRPKLAICKKVRRGLAV